MGKRVGAGVNFVVAASGSNYWPGAVGHRVKGSGVLGFWGLVVSRLVRVSGLKV